MRAAPFPFGLRAHDYGKRPLAELGGLIAATGASFLQLAPAKALAGVADPARDFGPAAAAEAARDLHGVGLRVAVLGSYVELGAADPGRAREARARFEASLSAAAAIRAAGLPLPTVATEAGHPGWLGLDRKARNRALRRALGELADRAEREGLRIAIEAARGHLVASPRELRALLADLASPSLFVILDPVNLMDRGEPGRALRRSAEVLEFAGGRIAAIHLKDCLPLGSAVLPVPPGRGRLDYRALFELLASAGLRVPLIIEDCPPAELPRALELLEASGAQRVASDFGQA
jgi:sugar phosphate isomerase/epimerase